MLNTIDAMEGLQNLVHGASAVDHVLPDHHAQAVTVPVPPGRFNLHVFAQHVEAQFFHLGNVLIIRSCQHICII